MTQKQRPGCCLGGAGGGGGGSGNQSEEGVPSCVLLPLASWPLLPPPRRALTLPHASPQPDPTSCSPSPQSPPPSFRFPSSPACKYFTGFSRSGLFPDHPPHPSCPCLPPPEIFSRPIPSGPVRLCAWALARTTPPHTSPHQHATPHPPSSFPSYFSWPPSADMLYGERPEWGMGP